MPDVATQGRRPARRTDAVAAPTSRMPPTIANPLVISRCSFLVLSWEPSAL